MQFASIWNSLLQWLGQRKRASFLPSRAAQYAIKDKLHRQRHSNELIHDDKLGDDLARDAN